MVVCAHSSILVVDMFESFEIAHVNANNNMNAIVNAVNVNANKAETEQLLTSYTGDRLQSRGLCVALSASLGGIGYLLLLTVTENNHVRYFATFCITSGTYTVIGVIIAWCKFAVRLSRIIWLTIFLVAHNLGSETKKATGIPLYMAIGQCGSVLGSHIFPATEGPRYM